MEEMKKSNLDEQQKKDVETFAQLPADANRDMKNFVAGMMSAYSRMGLVAETMDRSMTAEAAAV